MNRNIFNKKLNSNAPTKQMLKCFRHFKSTFGNINLKPDLYGENMTYTLTWAKHIAIEFTRAEIHILNGGHMALETNLDEVSELIKKFMLIQ